MDNKEKLEEAKRLYETANADQRYVLERLFLELRESEDERIRKALKEYFIKNFQNNGVAAICGVHIKDVLAWLEKKCEQTKKHNVCDTCDEKDSCISPCCVKLVEKQGEQKSQLPKVKGIPQSFKERLGEFMQYTSIDLEKNENQQLLDDAARELLQLAYSDKANEIALQSAKTWEESMAILIAANNAYRRGKKEQKLAWSVEDNRIVAEIHHALESCEYEWDSDMSKEKDWLESLGNRVQPKQEWSGGDEAHLHSLITHLEQWIERHPNTTGADVQGENIAWLKSLRPQNTWKPSEEQMKALYDSIPENVMEISEREMLLNELYKDLKKL